MRHIAYILSMPNIGSWNGKWTGEGNFYCRVRSYKSESDIPKKVTSMKYCHYNFGDGWAAGITIEEITSKEKQSCVKKSKGFFGYEWMIDEIEKYGRIRSIHERNQDRSLKKEGILS